MSKESVKYLKVRIQNNKTGEITKSQSFIVPKPGEEVFWNIRIPFISDDICVRVEWPLKK